VNVGAAPAGAWRCFWYGLKGGGPAETSVGLGPGPVTEVTEGAPCKAAAGFKDAAVSAGATPLIPDVAAVAVF